MTMRSQKLFTLQELRRVVILCPHCGTEVVLDTAEFTPPVPPRPGGRNKFAPGECPACKVPYDTAVAALEDLQRVYRTLAKLDGVVTFRPPEPEKSDAG
jgi:hypothetical protein